LSGVSVETLANLAAAQWLGVEVARVQSEDGSTVTVTVPPGLSSAEKERFIRMAEDMARHFGPASDATEE
jgi:hypothetical protein